MVKKVLIVIGVFIFLLVVGRSLFFSAKINGQGMKPTLTVGSRVLVYKYAGSFSNGDIIAYNPPEKGKLFIQRIIASEGQTVNLDFKKNEIYVDGALLNESYVSKKQLGTIKGVKYPVTVPKDSYYVLGDNREVSLDSRFPEIGFVNKKQIFGKVVYIFGKA